MFFGGITEPAWTVDVLSTPVLLPLSQHLVLLDFTYTSVIVYLGQGDM